MTKHPLYLDQSKVTRVEWDHAALKIISHQQSPLWFPLEKIAYVMVTGNIDWEGEALQQCMQANVSITFTNHDGFSGFCSGKAARPSHLHSQLVTLYEQYSDQLTPWFAQQQHHKMAQLNKQFHTGDLTHKPDALKHLLNQHICLQYQYFYWQRDSQQLTALLTTQHYHLLPYFGFFIQQFQQSQIHHQLAESLIKLAEWELWQRAAQGHLPKHSNQKQRIHYFHQHQLRIEQKTRYYIHSLWKTLSEYSQEQTQ